MNNKKFILASSSPQRLDLLKKINVIPSSVIHPEINEDVLKKEKPYAYVKRLAQQKAQIVYAKHSSCYVLGADTSVIRGAKILGKPNNEDEALKFLNLLSGRKHQVITSYCIYKPDGSYILKAISSDVVVKNLSDIEKKWYISTGEWKNKAGGYSISGRFEVFVKQINGCISNVIGLPLPYVYNSLLGLGYNFTDV